MNLLLASLLGAAPAPAFDVPIREISLWMHGPELHNLLEVTPGRCALWAPGQAEPTRVTARLNALHVEDLHSLMMVSLGQGQAATAWLGDDPLARRGAEPSGVHKGTFRKQHPWTSRSAP